ncbi:hypothetical protein PG2000B_0805 [Bifidobacterium pseudolongum subsp. globosum]|nr:hypothetical protein PG2000B_0805 [Bifidobacterium pseudolongum subsp. globosum]
MLPPSYTDEEPNPSNGNLRRSAASRITVYKPYRVYKTHSGASYTDRMHNPNLPHAADGAKGNNPSAEGRYRMLDIRKLLRSGRWLTLTDW